MRKTLALAAFLLITLTASAQRISFGAPFPLTNTRYGTSVADPLLVSTGDTLYAFWGDARVVRMTRVVDGEQRVGLPILTAPDQASSVGDVAVAWTGSHFVVAATFYDVTNPIAIVTRQIAPGGEPLGGPVTVATAGARAQALAFNGRTLLLLSWTFTQASTDEVHALPLTADGRPAGTPPSFVARGREARLASNGDGFAAIVSGTDGVIRLVTFDGNGVLIETTELSVEVTDGRNIAIASNGDGYLAVFTGLTETTAVPVDASGETGPKLTLETREASLQRYPFIHPSATWTGSEWAVVFTKADSQSSEMIAVTVDAEATRIASREAIANAHAAGIATAAGRTSIARLGNSGFPMVPQLVHFPLAVHTPRDLTYKALDQTIVASAATADAMLVVWRERRADASALRAGIRTRSGDWVERTLADDITSEVFAASAGGQFAVFFRRGNTVVAQRLDRQLQLLPEVTLPQMPGAAASNGSVYALFGSGKAFTFTPAGVVGPLVQLSPVAAYKPSIASDGDGFLVTWIANPDCQFLLCNGGYGIVAVRLGDELHPLDAPPLTITSAYAWNAPAAWNGEEYVIAWSSEDGQYAATVPRSGPASAPKRIASRASVLELRAIAARGGVLITGRDYDIRSAWVERVFFLDADNTASELDPIVHADVFVTAPPRIEAWGDGLLAYLVSQTILAAPQHGASHVTMALEAFGLPPGAPLVKATISQRTVTLSWSEVSGAVNGYRVEYRIGDGSWNEVEQWFGPTQRQTTIRLPFSGQRASFRVRAWSDAGTGAYSNPISVNTPRRRAVR